jgi:gliding motility-associated-like protein
MKKLFVCLIFLICLKGSFAQMDTYGTTTGTCDCYQLTDEITNEAGSIWSPNSILLTNSFDLTFEVYLGDSDPGADGMVFVLRRFPGDPGASGGSLGYGDILNSVGVEIDTYYNDANGDVVEDHVGMHSNGEVLHDLVAPIAIPNIEDGNFHTFRVTWDPTLMEMDVYLDGTFMFSYSEDLVASYFEDDPEVFFGWTAGTGGAFNQQTVCSYRDVEFTTDHTDELGVTLACPGEVIVFNDLSTSDLIYNELDIIDWEWEFGDGATSTDEMPSHAYDSPGTYAVTLRVYDITGCFSETSISVEIGGIAMDPIWNEPTCFGFSDGSLTIDIPDGVEDPTFTITDAEGNTLNEDNSNTANELATGWYYFSVSDESGCSSVLDSIFLDQPGEMEADLTISEPLCYGENSGWVRVDNVINSTGEYDNIAYFWAPNPAGNEGIGEDSTWALPAGDYTLTINDENGCSAVIDFSLDEPDSLFLSEFGTEPAHCRLFDYQNGNGVVFGAATGGTPDFDYEWLDLESGATEDNTTWGGLNPGDYQLTVTDDNGCTLIRTITLDSLNPQANFNVISEQLNEDLQGTAPVDVVFENTSVHFYNENDPFGDTTFFWSLNEELGDWEVTHDYFYQPDTIYGPKGQTYQVNVCLVALNKNGCSDTLCQELTIYEPVGFEPVNIFSPNGDNVNDVFTFAFRAASISEFSCVIVNRWGNVIAELNDIEDGWDGTDQQGNLVSDGVYFYTYRAVTDNNNVLNGQGTIQLVTNL